MSAGEGGLGWAGRLDYVFFFFYQIPLSVEKGKVSLSVLKEVQNRVANLALFNPSLVSWS